jgi:hypothetical protein
MKSFLSAFFTLLFLCGCGVKPGGLAPPAGSDINAFPRTYPASSTDPAPLTRPADIQSTPLRKPRITEPARDFDPNPYD